MEADLDPIGSSGWEESPTVSSDMPFRSTSSLNAITTRPSHVAVHKPSPFLEIAIRSVALAGIVITCPQSDQKPKIGRMR